MGRGGGARLLAFRTGGWSAMSWDGPASGEHLLFLAPHPDDETLAAGALLQRTIARGGRARVVFATDGDNNPWTQRLVEGRIRIRPDDSARFGRRRRAEALAALAELGLAADDALFLGLPDQAITDLVIAGDGGAVERLAAVLRDWRTTLLVLPSLFDLHPDHSALAVLMRLALERASPDPLPRALSYIVRTHRRGDGRQAPGDSAPRHAAHRAPAQVPGLRRAAGGFLQGARTGHRPGSASRAPGAPGRWSAAPRSGAASPTGRVRPADAPPGIWPSCDAPQSVARPAMASGPDRRPRRTDGADGGPGRAARRAPRRHCRSPAGVAARLGQIVREARAPLRVLR
ncbi:MAG: hypothetical protein DMF51_07340 [Acidobacteria bacterium]|nr:MAG: hypothetical protein DMF51_07340 [Acidobacteriota bacterium]